MLDPNELVPLVAPDDGSDAQEFCAVRPFDRQDSPYVVLAWDRPGEAL